MKNISKRFIALAALLCVAMTSIAGCGDKSKSSSGGSSANSSDDVTLQYPFTVGDAGDADIKDPNGDVEIAEGVVANTTEPSQQEGSTAAVTTAAKSDSNTPAATQTEIVTDAKGETVTEAVTVTDASGSTVTDAKGETVTTMVPVYNVVTTPSGNSEKTTSSGDNYKSETVGKYAMWLDISKDENFYFEGDFIKITFKVKDTTPDGDYKVRISPDLSNIAGTSVSPGAVIDGTITVNGSAKESDIPEGTDMVFYGDNVSVKPGDTFEYYLNVKNNTGLAAFFIWFYYDSNAFEFVNCKPSGEFADISTGLDSGG